MAQVSLRGTPTSNNRTGTGSLTISKPSGVVDGDILIAHFVLYGSGGTVDTLSGWTLIDSYNANEPSSYLFWKKAASEGTDYTWNISAGGNANIGTITALQNTHQTSPVDGHTVKRNTSSTTVTGDAITPSTAPESLLMAFAGWQNAGYSISGYAVVTTNPTWTEAYEYSRDFGTSDAAQSMAYASRDVITSTGSFTATLSSADVNVAHLISIRPAGFSFEPPVLALTTTTQVPAVASAQSILPPAMAITATPQVPTIAQADPKWVNQDKNSASWNNVDKTP